jgi:hypothetical protein
MNKQVKVATSSEEAADESLAERVLAAAIASGSRQLSFSDPDVRNTHIRVFLAWLPKVLHDVPGIAWDRLPSPVMGYLIRGVTGSPDAIPITLAIGCAMDAVKNQTLLGYCRQLTQLFRKLRAQYGMNDFADLRTRSLWDRFVSGRTPSSGEVHLLGTYEALATLHERAYLERLDVRQHLVWEPYVLPPLPPGLLEKQGLNKASLKVTELRRREQADVLVPLFPLLVEMAQLRKQAAERLIKEFRLSRDRAIAGEITLPYQFQYTDRQFSFTEDASSIADVRLIEQEVTHPLTLWDRASWLKAHPERYARNTHRNANLHLHSYAPERTLYFLQYEGSPSHLLWCGEVIAHQGLGHVTGGRRDYWASRPGLLTPMRSDSVWLNWAWRAVPEAVIFEPESLYRATLYAAALATLALTNGSRLGELLQVSATRFETIVVDELSNQHPTGRKIGILVQNLLPKGYRQESERQFFLIGEMAGRLLMEIGQLLEATHGGMIPIVHPNAHSKEEDLQPEPYLFQWSASAGGRLGLLTSADVGSLLRFLFHGLQLSTRTGKPIRVAPHLLRHVMATHARTVQKVPAEAVAYLLHHRVILPDSRRTLTISEATAYYSRLTMEQLLALLFEAQSTLISHRNLSYLQAPLPRSLEQMEDALRNVFEQWGMLGPTALGYCSAGLCIRPNNRALCLNCPHLVPHYSNLLKAKTWRKLYVLQADLHDAHGHTVDAQQARQMIQYLDDIINLMQIQIRTRQNGGYCSFVDTLPPGQDDEGEEG